MCLGLPYSGPNGYANQYQTGQQTFSPPETRDLSRLVCCSDGNFRPEIAAEAFERNRKHGR